MSIKTILKAKSRYNTYIVKSDDKQQDIIYSLYIDDVCYIATFNLKECVKHFNKFVKINIVDYLKNRRKEQREFNKSIKRLSKAYLV